jgi:long-subunit fatty acid transport protein
MPAVSLRLPALLLGACVAFAWPLALGAQSNDEIATGMQLNLSTPGARSLAMGGAFLGAADDATAAYTNPAGLAQLVGREVSVEGRLWDYTSRFTARGHLPETGVTGIGIDTVGGLEEGEIATREAAPSFVSYVETGNHWALAVYRHQLADFSSGLDTQGAFVGPRGAPFRLTPARSRLSLEVANYGLSGALTLPGGVSLGLGLSWYDFALASHTNRYFRAEPTGDLAVDGLTGNQFGPADFLPANILNTQTQHGDDHALAGSLGLLWRIDARWSLGAVYRQGPDFAFEATFVDGPAGELPGQVDPDLGGVGTFHLPDSYGVGVAYRPADPLLVTLDWNHVEYSDLADELLNVLRAARGEEHLFRIDDANEIRFGGELQTLAWRYPVAFRAGAWWDPDHRLRYTGSTQLRARFRPGDDAVHWSAGLGVVIHRLQLDLAVDRSPAVDTLSLSAVTRF